MAHLTLLLTIFFLLGHTACAGAEPLGRLFFSPDERTLIDQERQKSSGSTVSATGHVTLDGLVRRGSGKTTAWINGLPQNETSQGVTVQGPAVKPSTLLMLPSGKQIRLKPGQSFDTAKGRVREGFESANAPLPPNR
ncbi:hypothetical protein [Propionivibrio sp.]|uniref:hypothetical protein n=1 Tax=Propionivibrio sp. TaxID=2212460 RepID=UPI003BEF6784